MNRGRGNFTPRGRGRGGAGASPSHYRSADRRSPKSAGGEPSLSGERTWERKEMSGEGKKMSRERKSAPKQAQLDAYNKEFSSLEFNYRAEVVVGDLLKSEESESSSNVHENSSASRGRFWERNDRSCGSRLNTQGHHVWKQTQPVSYKATSPQSIVPEKGSSVDGPLNLDQSLLENLERPIEKSCKDPESVGGSENLKKDAPLKEKSWPRNKGSSGRRYVDTHTGWKQVQPVAYKTMLPQSNLPEKGSSVDRPLNLDQSRMELLERPTEKSCKDIESVGDSGSLKKADSSQHSECAAHVEPFDICPPPKAGVVKLNLSLHVVNKENRKQMKHFAEPRTILLRSGMVLLKNYISLPEQVAVVNECRKLGKGEGGFYQPGYRDGAKLILRMMCLGKNWDPQTSRYGDIRPIDGVKPPSIPGSFFELVNRSINEAHTQISKECGSTGKGVEAILPWMSPDICIVNFYTISGRLGLHQDRDESESSLNKGLPVVSISIGDTAVFLYGDQSDFAKAERVELESGDVLIFGGKSRRVFHGVSSITPNTAPKSLLDMTNLRAGRLNLTFRKY